MSDDALAGELATWAGRLLIEARESALLSGAAMGAAGTRNRSRIDRPGSRSRTTTASGAFEGFAR